MNQLATKHCGRCGLDKPFEDFPLSTRSAHGRGTPCKACAAKAARMYRKNFPRRALSSQLRSYYGITMDEYDEMFASQNGACAACGGLGAPRRDRLRPLVVDHDHATGKVRALLCNTCNIAIGMAAEDPNRLRLLAAYLERHRSDG